MRYFIITFGCQMNRNDSERIAAVLETMGYKKASKINRANLIIVNMCSVRQSAVDRVYSKIKNFAKLKNQNPKLKTLLTGCILRRDLKKFKEHFDYILSIKTLPYWGNLLEKEKFFYYPDPRDSKFNRKFNANYLKIEPKFANNFSAFVPISIGCNNFCTYCVVPYTRGPETSRPADQILVEVKKLAKRNFKEIWLLGQNVNSYSWNTKQETGKGIDFSQLLETINEIEGNFWIRFTSSHPKDFSDKLIKTIAECKKVTEYINLPVQSGDDEILKRMNRPYTVSKYKNLVKKIRNAISNVCLSTDVIVGFPGETKEQFENTAKLFKEIKFDMAYIAEYSPRPQTAAFEMKDDVSKEEKERRRRVLTEILKKTALENNKKYIGKTLNVLVENSKNGFLMGKTRTYKTIKFKSKENLIGEFVKVKIINATPWGLKGKLI